ncbi:MAG: hypothetical protein AAF581_11565 [Planctomycetota bacterium]
MNNQELSLAERAAALVADKKAAAGERVRAMAQEACKDQPTELEELIEQCDAAGWTLDEFDAHCDLLRQRGALEPEAATFEQHCVKREELRKQLDVLGVERREGQTRFDELWQECQAAENRLNHARRVREDIRKLDLQIAAGPSRLRERQ